MESILKADLAPILKLVNLMPSDTPPVKTGVQRGEKVGGSGLSIASDGEKVVGKVFSTHSYFAYNFYVKCINNHYFKAFK